MRHVLYAQQFDRAYLETLFQQAKTLQDQWHNDASCLRDRLSCCTMFAFFYEPSTRTRFSFTTAARRLGMDVDVTESAGTFSSAAKGETLEDSIRVMCEYEPSVIVLRHPDAGAAQRAAEVSTPYGVSIINAGDGRGQHPTQALLDLYTIQKERGGIEDQCVLVGGDLAHSRTARSLIYLLSKYPGVEFEFISPAEFSLTDDLRGHLDEHHVAYREHTQMDADAFGNAHVVYWTRAQKERQDESSRDVANFIITPATLDAMREDAVILHPLPRVNEIAKDVDADARAAYFRQAGHGVFLRMALLTDILNHHE